jgi:hypothetical protein
VGALAPQAGGSLSLPVSSLMTTLRLTRLPLYGAVSHYRRAFRMPESQSSPSKSPSPLTALVR